MTTYSIVGAHFRPPAKAIVQVLPSGCPLQVIPEPDNPYDANALKVCVMTSDIPEDQHQALDELAAGYGSSWADIAVQEQWHLGYIPRTDAVNLAPQLSGETAIGELTFNMRGAPAISLDL